MFWQCYVMLIVILHDGGYDLTIKHEFNLICELVEEWWRCVYMMMMLWWISELWWWDTVVLAWIMLLNCEFVVVDDGLGGE